MRSSIGAGAAAAAIGSYATVIEPNRITTKSVEVRLSRLPDGLDGIRIAHISDLHYESFLTADHIRDAVTQINDMSPDMVVMTGDFATYPFGIRKRRYRAGAVKAVPCAEVLAQLRAPLGRFAVLGNHDAATDPDLITESMTAQGLMVLRNRALPVERNGARIWVAGVDDMLEGQGDIPGTMQRVPRDEMVIGLVHEPDIADELAKYGVDLQLSGHSHGGQVRIPLLGAPILPPLSRKYPLGWYKIRDLQLYTNPGLGVVGLPLRFDCPPEITVLTLRRS